MSPDQVTAPAAPDYSQADPAHAGPEFDQAAAAAGPGEAAPSAPVSAYGPGADAAAQPGDGTRIMQPGAPQPAPPAVPHMAAPGGPPPYPPPGGPMYSQPGAPIAPPKQGRGKLVAGALALALLAGGAGGIAGYWLSDGKGGTTTVESVSMDAGDGQTYTDIVNEVSPSVVTIVTDAAEGSGVVYSDDGYIVTNNHVVDGAQSVEVRFSDGSSADAEIVATDATQDLAVIQVSGGEDLTPVAFGDSDSLQVGDVTVAIGSPLGLEGTVTTGIVSALNRSMTVAGEDSQMQSAQGTTLSGLIQTDAAINMGNSGGALVNGNGELVGINSAIATTESGSIGLGFAIPSNTVKDVVDQLIEHGSVEQGYLGVSVSDTDGNGAMVLAVEDGSPAAEAGLQEGDVITKIDDQDVTSAAEVVSVVQSKASGDKVTITFTRDDQEQTTEATLATQ
ncbi:S1C family serine protease [Glycomyces buryatensis]|uniref:S1C family serine protease n=1 Tax=Glycomyces buryatensis TaxID=2570927 RepID=UPI0014562933|nr:trypsin-like peptidase domain-containing protein [Glycomyces buryatensis]